ncbi:MAG: hypothetical protein D6719_03805 [Candidatus Dadabacteria bacterium]|nr:MAG: hypothetical protein D6719_03805 [Candidatus Dadabacteria bacterium]
MEDRISQDNRIKSQNDPLIDMFRGPDAGRLPESMPPELRAVLGTLLETLEQKKQERSRELIIDAFKRLEHLPDTSDPLIQSLKEYGKSVEDYFDQIDDYQFQPAHEVEAMLSRLSPGELKAGFSKMIARLRKESDALKELEDVGVAEALEVGLKNGKFGAKVIFTSPDSKLASIAPHAAAFYYGPLDIIVVKGDIPTRENMWRTLVTQGGLPKEIAVLDHELTHDRQWLKGQRLAISAVRAGHFGFTFGLAATGGPLKGIFAGCGTLPLTMALERQQFNDKILSETHAFEASASSPVMLEEQLDEMPEIVTNVAAGYSRARPIDFIKSLEAFKLTRTLRLFGLDDKEIGKLVSKARWDSDKGTYPKLEKRLAEERKKHGLENNQDFITVRNALLARQAVERARQRMLASQIAYEELDLLARPLV